MEANLARSLWTTEVAKFGYFFAHIAREFHAERKKTSRSISEFHRKNGVKKFMVFHHSCSLDDEYGRVTGVDRYSLHAISFVDQNTRRDILRAAHRCADGSASDTQAPRAKLDGRRMKSVTFKAATLQRDRDST
jgi:hypothetical protein